MSNCPLCLRALGMNYDQHHLIPRTFKGKETVDLHRICHQKIHSCLSERELLNYYHTIERLLEHPEIQKFVKWVSKKHPDFYDTSVDSRDRKRRR